MLLHNEGYMYVCVYIYEHVCLLVGLSIYPSISHLCDMNAYLIVTRPKLRCHFVQSNGMTDSLITRQGWISVGDSKVMAMVTSCLRMLHEQIF